MKFYLYECRHGDDRRLLPHTVEGWEYARALQDTCNGMGLKDIIDEGFDISGSYEEGYLSIDDGGSIETIELTEV